MSRMFLCSRKSSVSTSRVQKRRGVKLLLQDPLPTGKPFTQRRKERKDAKAGQMFWARLCVFASLRLCVFAFFASLREKSSLILHGELSLPRKTCYHTHYIHRPVFE